MCRKLVELGLTRDLLGFFRCLTRTGELGIRDFASLVYGIQFVICDSS